MIDGAPENIIWCYSMYQPAYDEMLKTVPNIMFFEGVPGDLQCCSKIKKAGFSPCDSKKIFKDFKFLKNVICTQFVNKIGFDMLNMACCLSNHAIQSPA